MSPSTGGRESARHSRGCGGGAARAGEPALQGVLLAEARPETSSSGHGVHSNVHFAGRLALPQCHLHQASGRFQAHGAGRWAGAHPAGPPWVPAAHSMWGSRARTSNTHTHAHARELEVALSSTVSPLVFRVIIHPQNLRSAVQPPCVVTCALWWTQAPAHSSSSKPSSCQEAR